MNLGLVYWWATRYVKILFFLYFCLLNLILKITMFFFKNRLRTCWEFCPTFRFFFYQTDLLHSIGLSLLFPSFFLYQGHEKISSFQVGRQYLYFILFFLLKRTVKPSKNAIFSKKKKKKVKKSRKLLGRGKKVR